MKAAFLALVLSLGIYPAAGTVTQTDRAADLVTVQTACGHVWQFEGVEDWIPGDGCALLMSDNGTPGDVTDDVIINARYTVAP